MRKEFVIGVGAVLAIVLVAAWLRCIHSNHTVDTLPATSSTPAAAARGRIAHPVAVRTIATGTHAVDGDKQANYAAYAEEGLAKIWKYAYGATKPIPAIDFSKEYVIAVFAGEKPTGGYVVEASSVTDDGESRVVTVTLTSPGKGCMVTEALSAPFQIVAVPLSGSTLSHSDVKATESCN